MCGQRISGTAEISFLIIAKEMAFVKKKIRFFSGNFGDNGGEVICS